MWETVISKYSELFSSENILSAIGIFINRPHILNDRVIGSKVLEEVVLQSTEDVDLGIQKVLSKSFDLEQGFNLNNLFMNSLHTRGALDDILSTLSNLSTVLVLRKLLPKLPDRFSEFDDIIIIEVNDNFIKVMFFPKPSHILDKDSPQVAPVFPFQFFYEKKSKIVSLNILASNSESKSPSCHWLEEVVFPRIIRWASQEKAALSSLPSLALVPIEIYCKHKQRLKTKYAKKLVESWTESTDPQKFVHEDIAIAAYLMTIWECELDFTCSDRKQSFVDLGCGNGLLVYILSSEGHQGIGIDLKKRGIWDSYGKETILKESVLKPSEHCLFPEYDWLIGNHSDELTPWIPMIAARSSYNMKVFLLPCCAFTFNGKYQRTFPGSSQYQSYLNFVQDLCQEAGFVVHRDKLRIPSTKRICFVCSSRTYNKCEEKQREQLRVSYIAKHSQVMHQTRAERISADGSPSSESCSNKVNGFVPRNKLELVRNCTQLDRTFLDETVNTLAQMLLAQGEQHREIKMESGVKQFKFGGFLSICELAERLTGDTKSKLKQQCGGLQTLLRNHKHIFQITDGLVSVTTPRCKSEQSSAKFKRKDSRPKKNLSCPRPCWFYLKHPQGCPWEESQCTFLHSPS